MRFALTVLIALIAAPALAYDNPKELVQAIYAPYQTPGAAADQDPAQYYSERLKGLVSQQANAATEQALSGDAGPASASALGFNPFIAAEHSLLIDLLIDDPIVMGEQATIAVSFHNFDSPTLLSLSLVKEPDGWKVDDVASLGDGEHWLLSWLLQYDPFQVN